MTALDPGAPWVQHLERAHAFAQRAALAIEEQLEPSPFLEPAARRLERGLGAIYDAFDARADRPTSIEAAHARLWDAAILVARAGMGAALGDLRSACAELIAAGERFPRVPIAGRAPAPLVAGDRELALHTVERTSLLPKFRAPALLVESEAAPILAQVEPRTFEELGQVAALAKKVADEKTQALLARPAPRALTREDLARKIAKDEPEAPEGFAFVPPAPIEGDAFIRRWTRECFDEIGMLGVQRTPMEGDDWREIFSLERRMIGAVDAIAALGPVAVAEVERLAMDAAAADPMKVYAAAIVSGCLEGRDALAAAERVLHRFGAGDPFVAEAFAAAMKIAPHPFLAGAMRSLAASDVPANRAVGVEVLACRWLLSAAELEDLSRDPDPRILAQVLPLLGSTRHPASHRAFAESLAHADPRVRVAALRGMAISAHPEATNAAKSATTAGDPGAAVLLAILADQATARWLLDCANARPSVENVTALGWTGLLDAIPALISWLESKDDEEVSLAAGAALERILGAGILDFIEVMPEALDDTQVTDPDPDAKPERRPLADLVSDPRDKPPPGSAEKLEVPSIDPEKWRAYWIEQGKKLDPQLRYRRGRAHTPSVALWELDRVRLSASDRRILQVELAARTAKITRFDPIDFVAVQERCLQAWSPLAASSSAAEGSWARPIAR